MKQSFKILRVPIALMVIASLGACGDAPDWTRASEMTQVSLASELQHPRDWADSHLLGSQTVEVRPQVSGQIKRVTFSDGALVEKGDLLFQIDPSPFEHEVRRLEAQLRQAQARYKHIQNSQRDGMSLFSRAANQKELSEARAVAARESRAEVQAIEVQLEQARLNISFTLVTAPITGRVSQAKISAGNDVKAGVTPLTSVVSFDNS